MKVVVIREDRWSPVPSTIRPTKSRLVFDITARPPLPNVRYERGEFVIYDGAKPGENPNFIRPNTTILVDVILNRRAASKIMQLKDSSLQPLTWVEPLAALEAAAGPETELTGRARLLQPSRKTAGAK